MEKNNIYLGDCLDIMSQVPGGSVDMILCDLPYGTTKCKWDKIIPFAQLWAHYERVIKPNGAIVLTASQPFTSYLIMSNPALFRYELIWEKSNASGFLDANRRPLKAHENILVFYKQQPVFNPQKWEADERFRDRRKALIRTANDTSQVYGKQKKNDRKPDDGSRYPISVIPVASHWGRDMHSTQKPVPLFAWLIRTFTNTGDIVLDNCSGSGTTAIACIDESRNYICIEKDPEIHAESVARVKNHISSIYPKNVDQMKLF